MVFTAEHGVSLDETRQAMAYVATRLLRGEPDGPGLSMRVTLHVLETAAHVMRARLSGHEARPGEFLNVLRTLVDLIAPVAGVKM